MQDKFTKTLLVAMGILVGVLLGTTLLRQDPAQAQAQRGTGVQGVPAGVAGGGQSGDSGVAVGVSGNFVFIAHSRGTGADLGTYVYYCDPATRKVSAVTP